MDSLSRITNLLSTPTTFIHFTCVSPNHSWTTSNNHNQTASNQISVPMPSSLINIPRKIIDKIIKAIIPYIICFKTKLLDKLSTHSKKIIKKINKAIHYQILKMKKEEQDKCLWKKTILMGEKCQPLEFPGAIFYDSEGNQLSEPPRTPRSSHLMSFGQHLSEIN
ncbi:nucleolar protein [Trifolium repens]|jgi:hypothetical protein|nr:nucleolar protein [Trifolium repens]